MVFALTAALDAAACNVSEPSTRSCAVFGFGCIYSGHNLSGLRKDDGSTSLLTM